MSELRMVAVSGVVTLSKIIACECCGQQRWSDHTIHLTPRTPVSELQSIVAAQMPRIPVGWAMSGRDHITCDYCLEKRSEQ